MILNSWFFCFCLLSTRIMLLCPVYMVMGIEPRASCMVGKHSTNWITCANLGLESLFLICQPTELPAPSKTVVFKLLTLRIQQDSGQCLKYPSQWKKCCGIATCQERNLVLRKNSISGLMQWHRLVLPALRLRQEDGKFEASIGSTSVRLYLNKTITSARIEEVWWHNLRCFLCPKHYSTNWAMLPACQNVPERSKPASRVWAASTSMAQWASQCESPSSSILWL